MKNYCEVKPKEVIDINLNEMQNNAPKLNAVLALENNHASWYSLHKE